MVIVYVLAGNIAGIALAALTMMWGGSLIGAVLVYWLACSVVAVLVAMLSARVSGRKQRRIDPQERRIAAQTSRQPERGILRPIRSTD